MLLEIYCRGFGDSVNRGFVLGVGFSLWIPGAEVLIGEVLRFSLLYNSLFPGADFHDLIFYRQCREIHPLILACPHVTWETNLGNRLYSLVCG